MPIRMLAAILALACSTIAAAQADAPRTKDHPLLKRYEGSTILQAVPNAYDEYVVPLGPNVGPRAKERLGKSKTIEGSVTRITYAVPPGRSTLEVMRNYENELKGAGFVVLFQGAGQEALGFNPYMKVEFAKAAGYGVIKMPRSPGFDLASIVSTDQRFLAARLARPEGEVHVVLFATTIDDLYNSVVSTDPQRLRPPAKGQVFLQVDIIESKPMDTKMVTVDASKMAAEIATSGSIALYGIHFDTNSAKLKAESDPTLAEIAKLLKAQPAMKLLVVGHTDNVGTYQANLDLSQRRAAAVVKALAGQHGIDARRLTPLGVSFASPVASNKTEDGKAKNRRVQLVEQ